jgi:HSP20 family molecular chaperone IbpA
VAQTLKVVRLMACAIPVEIHHHREAMAITARLPGVRIEDLRIALSRDELTIEARSPAGKQALSLLLATPIDERRATMRFADGVLSLYLPRLPR